MKPESVMGNHLVADRFVLEYKLGKGSFGDVYLGRDKNTREEVAIKFEANGKHPQRLAFEKYFYNKVHGGEGIPHVRWYGQYGDYNALVIDLLGPSLEDLFRQCSRTFSLKTVLMLADDMIIRLQHVHSQSIVHRDIKPENFLMGLGEKAHIVHLVDYGLAVEYYRNPVQCKNHVPAKPGRGLTGTARYASINAHQGVSQAPRDDMEALLHTLIYFLKGSLPWQSIQGEVDKQRADRILECKMSTPIELVCEDIPAEFLECLKYCRNLGYYDEPNYWKIRRTFCKLFTETNNFVFDYKYDWTIN